MDKEQNQEQKEKLNEELFMEYQNQALKDLITVVHCQDKIKQLEQIISDQNDVISELKNKILTLSDENIKKDQFLQQISVQLNKCTNELQEDGQGPTLQIKYILNGVLKSIHEFRAPTSQQNILSLQDINILVKQNSDIIEMRFLQQEEQKYDQSKTENLLKENQMKEEKMQKMQTVLKGLQEYVFQIFSRSFALAQGLNIDSQTKDEFERIEEYMREQLENQVFKTN